MKINEIMVTGEESWDACNVREWAIFSEKDRALVGIRPVGQVGRDYGEQRGAIPWAVRSAMCFTARHFYDCPDNSTPETYNSHLAIPLILWDILAIWKHGRHPSDRENWGFLEDASQQHRGLLQSWRRQVWTDPDHQAADRLQVQNRGGR